MAQWEWESFSEIVSKGTFKVISPESEAVIESLSVERNDKQKLIAKARTKKM